MFCNVLVFVSLRSAYSFSAFWTHLIELSQFLCTVLFDYKFDLMTLMAIFAVCTAIVQFFLFLMDLCSTQECIIFLF